MFNKNIDIGIIGGSGVYEFKELEDIEEVEIKTPFGSPSDKIITGRVGSLGVAFLPRHGKGHSIIPSRVNYRANIFAFKKLGVNKIIGVSAVGSMKEELAPGDLVIVDQYFDRTKNRPSTFFGNGLVAHIGFDKPVCSNLSELIENQSQDKDLKVHSGGTYICIEGPQFSTYAESRIYRSWDVDVIGMTAIPEAKLAREAEICYATMAFVTDYDCWNKDHDAVTADMVVKQVKENSRNAKAVLKDMFLALEKNDIKECSCRNALKPAIQTAPEAIDETMKEKLDILIGKYY
ncbi:MAG: S-methyl-5'-thioadenosine phosphorylase [Elusimicrobiota bacterium]